MSGRANDCNIVISSLVMVDFEKKPWSLLRGVLEMASFVAVIFGVGFGFAEYRDNKEAERREVAQRAYDAIDERFNDYQKLCLDNPELDCFSTPLPSPPQLNADQKVKQKLLYSILLGICERSFLSYHNRDYTDFHKEAFPNKWPAWDAVINNYASRPAFRALWLETASQYDLRFRQYLNKKIPI